MTGTDLTTVRELAGLARLALDEEELARLAPELERILLAFTVLARHARPSTPDGLDPRPGRLRGDEPVPSLARETLLASASTSEEGFFVVPKTVGGER